MMQHVVIRREEYVGGTRERPEVGVFTQTHSARPPVPWGRIAVGDRVWKKWSGGPIVATARVQGFRQIEHCTPEQLRLTTVGYKLHALDAYWDSLPLVFFGMTIYLEDERWLDYPIMPAARSRGESWIVLSSPALEAAWLENNPASGTSTASTTTSTGLSARGSRTISPVLRFEVLRRDDFRCRYCGRRAPDVVLHLDHIVPWSAGGRTTLENLRAACYDCNIGKGARLLDAGHG